MSRSLSKLGLILFLTACGDGEPEPGQNPDGAPPTDASDADAGPPGAWLDPDFGNGGVAVLELPIRPYDIHADPDGTILLVGERDGLPAVCRLTASGARDDTWGSEGCLVLGAEVGSQAHEVTPVGDEYVISVNRPGAVPIDPGGVVLWRLRRDGTVNPSIGAEGQIVLGPDTHDAIGSGMCVGVTPEGDHLLVGTIDSGYGMGFGAFRVSSAGSLVASHRLPSSNRVDLYGADRTETGDLLAAGRVEGGSRFEDEGVALRFSADLTAVTSVAKGLALGTRVPSIVGSGANALVATSSSVVRTLADGAVDPTFSVLTCEDCEFRDMVSVAGDRIAVSSSVAVDGLYTVDLHILHADGAPDESVGPGGRFPLPGHNSGVLAHANGRVLALSLRSGPPIQQHIMSILLD